VTVGAAQLPAPSQSAVLVAVPPVQEAVPHVVPAAVWAQLPFEAQVPVLPQAPLGAHRPCGSAAPVPTKLQVPALPVTLQAWHRGQAAAVVLQQTPSTQRPAAHWLSPLQPAPIPPAFWQVALVLQKLPDAQSDPLEQLVLQPLAVQAYVPQLIGACAGQVVLAGEQNDAGVKDDPLQVAGAHWAVELAQAPAPSQVLVFPHPVPVAPQRVSFVPAPSGAQVPAPFTLHAWQAGQLALPQQTPSVQLPLMHWVAALQLEPLGLRLQLLVPPLPWQVKGARQSPSAVHDVLQAPLPQV
jgi:hypothetical protein